MTTSHQPIGIRLLAARRAAKLTQQQLAERAGLSVATVSKLERGVSGQHTEYETWVSLAGALGTTVEWLTESQLRGGRVAPAERGAASRTVPPDESTGRAEFFRRPGGSSLMPVYKWGAAGDPRSRESSPDPDHEEYPPPGRESLVGPNGFGVIIKGESMAGRDLHDGDIVWVNPDRPPRHGGIVLARLRDDQGADLGMVVKTWDGDHLSLTSAPPHATNGHAAEDPASFEVIGPVVYATRHFQPL